MSTSPSAMDPAERKRNSRRMALWLALVAAAFYLGFIAMSVLRGS